MEDPSESDYLLFEVSTPLGFRVRATRSCRDMIICIKHPVMAGRELEVKETLENPEEIRDSRIDPDGYLFYRSGFVSRWVCAVTKHLNEDAFLITAYPAGAIKEGANAVILWGVTLGSSHSRGHPSVSFSSR